MTYWYLYTYQLLKLIDIQVYQKLHESSMSQDLIIVR
jgi:hypothetical protein